LTEKEKKINFFLAERIGTKIKTNIGENMEHLAKLKKLFAELESKEQNARSEKSKKKWNKLKNNTLGLILHFQAQ